MGTLAALAAAAFALGAGAGLLWKDPGLLLAQWMGETQEVAWSPEAAPPTDEGTGGGSGPLPAVELPQRAAAEPPEPAPGQAAAEPQARYETAAAEPVRAVAPPKPAPAAPSAAPPSQVARASTPPVSAAPPGGLAVQVGAFAERRSADQLIAKLRKDGFQAYASAADGGAWRVRVGPFRDRGGAEQAAARLKREQKLPTWVLEENGGR